MREGRGIRQACEDPTLANEEARKKRIMKRLMKELTAFTSDVEL